MRARARAETCQGARTWPRRRPLSDFDADADADTGADAASGPPSASTRRRAPPRARARRPAADERLPEEAAARSLPKREPA
eukprot:2861323-Pleurochrysis_carterae.AAC.2